MGKTANAPSSRPSSGRTVNKGVWSKSKGIKLYKGVCRIPPPK